ncbi:MAG: GlsB/YeaQ/YmgE family stress response membrane protein [Omnitrophica WOR_2 bacterium]
MGLLSWIVVGLIAGWLAGMVVKGGGFGIVGDIILGVVGALVGGFLAGALFNIPNPINGFSLQTLIVAIIGAIIVVWVVRLVTGRRAM